MKSILRDMGEIIWGSDSRLLCTLKDYIKPGMYTRNWLDKKQARYISPVKIFLTINLVYFLLLSLFWQYGVGFNTFVTPFESQIYNQLYSDLIRDASVDMISSKEFEISQFAALYNDRVFAVSNSLIIILSLLAAAILYMVNFRKSRLLYHHVCMGLYYGGFLLLSFLVFNIVLILVDVIAIYTNSDPAWLTNELLLSSFLSVFLIFFAFFCQIRMYRERKRIAFLKSVLIIFLFTFVGVIFYRFLLFWITFTSIFLFS